MTDKKGEFRDALSDFVVGLSKYATNGGEWTVKGFVDLYKNVYTISSDTKIISKILEIHLFPQIVKFATENGYNIVATDHQNYYPDMSFVVQSDHNTKFAVDFKTTYRLPKNPDYCNGFTLGSHGEYFINRSSTKNIQFPYGAYKGHFCLGIIYSRSPDKDESKIFSVDNINSITSVINNFEFFVAEKWKIASDSSGSGNTANIGSIKYIPDIIAGKGVFSDLGEDIFDDYWMNYNKISIADKDSGKIKTIRNLYDFLKYRGLDEEKIACIRNKRRSA